MTGEYNKTMSKLNTIKNLEIATEHLMEGVRQCEYWLNSPERPSNEDVEKIGEYIKRSGIALKTLREQHKTLEEIHYKI